MFEYCIFLNKREWYKNKRKKHMDIAPLVAVKKQNRKRTKLTKTSVVFSGFFALSRDFVENFQDGWRVENFQDGWRDENSRQRMRSAKNLSRVK